MGVVAGCSSTPGTDKPLNSSEAGEKGSDTDKSASLSPNQTPDTITAIPIPSYSSMDRAAVLQYVEKGGSDPENLSQALKLVQRAEKLSHAERTMEDYLVLATHYRIKGDMQKVVQHANQGIMAKSDSKKSQSQYVYLSGLYLRENQSGHGRLLFQASRTDRPRFL